jgi:hypothetical protein
MRRARFIVCFATAALYASEAGPWKEFRDRVESYISVRKKALQGLPKLKDKAEPEVIAAHKKAAAEAIRGARAQAAPGDIFTPATQRRIRQVVRGQMKGSQGTAAKQTAKDGNPVYEGKPVPLKVNASYPDSAPLSTMPPGLLLRMPELPKVLEYRFVGHNLVLHDVDAGIIVDFMPDAMP